MPGPAIGVRPRWLGAAPPKVNLSHPLAQGMVAAYRPIPGRGAVDLTGKCPPMALNGNPAHRSTPFGPAMYGNAGSAGAKLLCTSSGPTSQLRVTPPFSFAWVGEFVASSNGSPLFGMNYDDNDTNPWASWMIFRNASTIHIEYNAVGVYDETSGVTPTLGQMVVVGQMVGSAQQMFINGVLSGSDSNAMASLAYHGTASAFQFHYYTGESDATNAASALGCVWNRPLTMNEIQTFTADPFCFLRR